MSMIQVKENQLKLPLYPEWDEENKWKTGELAVTEVDLTVHDKNYTSWTMNGIPNTITFSVLGRDMLVIDESGIKWDKDGKLVEVENSSELAIALGNLFTGMTGYIPANFLQSIETESYTRGINDAIDVINNYPGVTRNSPERLRVKHALVKRLPK